jgi:hypothetical protein
MRCCRRYECREREASAREREGDRRRISRAVDSSASAAAHSSIVRAHTYARVYSSMQAGLVYSEKGNLSEVLCKPKMMPIKSITLEKIELMEKEHAKQGGR